MYVNDGCLGRCANDMMMLDEFRGYNDVMMMPDKFGGYVDIVMMPGESERGKKIMMPFGENLLICIDICKVRPCGANHLCARIMRSLLVNY